MNSFTQIFSKIKLHFKCQTEKELCSILAINYNTYYTWYQRGSIPWDLIAGICEKEKISMDGLIFDYQNLDLPQRLLLEKMNKNTHFENLALLQTISNHKMDVTVTSIINPGSPPWKDIEIAEKIKKIILVKCTGDNVMTMFGFLLLEDGTSIYLAEGRMNFHNGGHSGLKPLRTWLVDCNIWDKIDKELHFMDYGYFIEKIVPEINFSGTFNLNLVFSEMPESEQDTLKYFNIYKANLDW